MAVGVLVALSGGALAFPRLARIVSARLGTRPVDINLDHGLADCPWPDGVDPLDPVDEVRVKDRFVIVRTNQRVYFEGRVTMLTCYSAYLFGPDITIELPPGEPSPGAEYPAPALDPEIDRSNDDVPAALAAYRRARRIVDEFALPPEDAARARQSLDEWYRGNHIRGGASLGFVGTLATAGIVTELDRGADVVLSFDFRTDVNIAAVEVDSWKHDFRPQSRVKICFPMPVDGGYAWYQPPPHTEAEIAQSWFKPCPPSR